MSVKRIFDLLSRYKENWSNAQKTVSGKDNGVWVSYSIDEFIEKSTNISYGLLALGVEKRR